MERPCGGIHFPKSTVWPRNVSLKVSSIFFSSGNYSIDFEGQSQHSKFCPDTISFFFLISAIKVYMVSVSEHLQKKMRKNYAWDAFLLSQF